MGGLKFWPILPILVELADPRSKFVIITHCGPLNLAVGYPRPLHPLRCLLSKRRNDAPWRKAIAAQKIDKHRQFTHKGVTYDPWPVFKFLSVYQSHRKPIQFLFVVRVLQDLSHEPN